ncbi:hypothetical protein Bpfe_027558 [Biomphalaria pfeifferi]|uniref:Uncharacterized protein n=1 Tax=Biomphalaria pfeifferi TaxID=112525 RepID=A0AAD8AV70_BIOPF|nr:hypothetical protein Bpfe_027558 [Biomphalaria pfeifferi]
MLHYALPSPHCLWLPIQVELGPLIKSVTRTLVSGRRSLYRGRNAVTLQNRILLFTCSRVHYYTLCRHSDSILCHPYLRLHTGSHYKSPMSPVCLLHTGVCAHLSLRVFAKPYTDS